MTAAEMRTHRAQRMKAKKVNWCDRSVFYAPYYCLVTTPALFEQELQRIGIKERDWPDYTATPTANGTLWELETPSGESALIVTIKGWEGKDSLEVAGLIVHEATHIKQHVMRQMGEKFPSDEFEAYMMQNITQNLMQCFVEQTQ